MGRGRPIRRAREEWRKTNLCVSTGERHAERNHESRTLSYRLRAPNIPGRKVGLEAWADEGLEPSNGFPVTVQSRRIPSTNLRVKRVPWCNG